MSHYTSVTKDAINYTSVAYAFPFSTCESVSTFPYFPAQPLSVCINLLSCIYLYQCHLRSKHFPVFFLWLLVFECIHTLSHAIHLTGHIQSAVIHYVAYMTNLSLLDAFVRKTEVEPSHTFWAWYACILVLDVGFFFSNLFLGYFMTSLAMTASILGYYRQWIRMKYAKWVFSGMGVLVVLFVVETMWCGAFLGAGIPLHVFVEMVGVGIFVYVYKMIE